MKQIANCELRIANARQRASLRTIPYSPFAIPHFLSR